MWEEDRGMPVSKSMFPSLALLGHVFYRREGQAVWKRRNCWDAAKTQTHHDNLRLGERRHCVPTELQRARMDAFFNAVAGREFKVCRADAVNVALEAAGRFLGSDAEVERAAPEVDNQVVPKRSVDKLFCQLGHEPSWSANAGICTKCACYSAKSGGNSQHQESSRWGCGVYRRARDADQKHPSFGQDVKTHGEGASLV